MSEPKVGTVPSRTATPPADAGREGQKFIWWTIVFLLVGVGTTSWAYLKASIDDRGCLARLEPPRIAADRTTVASAKPILVSELFSCFALSSGTPCRVRSLFDLVVPVKESARDGCIDKFILWEIASLAQTFFISCIVFAEMKTTHITRPSSLIILINLASVIMCLQAIIEQDWHKQLTSTAVFLLCLMIVDCYLVWHEQDDQKLKRMFLLTIIIADLPIFLSNTLLVTWLWARFDHESHVFFAGATALSLLFSNILVFLIRLDKHCAFSRHSPLNAIG